MQIRLSDAAKDHLSDVVYETAKKLAYFHTGERKDHGLCMYCSFVGGLFFRHMGLDVSPIAGSASFRVLKREDDDGKRSTHLSFVFGEDRASRIKRAICIANGILPEMHVWLSLRFGNEENEKYETVDFSTRGLRDTWNEFKSSGQPGIGDWTAGDPPKFVWDNIENNVSMFSPRDDYAIYTTNHAACMFVITSAFNSVVNKVGLARVREIVAKEGFSHAISNPEIACLAASSRLPGHNNVGSN